jgi:hypothetical protein
MQRLLLLLETMKALGRGTPRNLRCGSPMRPGMHLRCALQRGAAGREEPRTVAATAGVAGDSRVRREHGCKFRV